jgi:RsiW-degrading membrane proteinase PrsW (M82 family)
MTTALDLEDLLILFVVALVPAIIYLAWVRSTETGQREGWGTVLRAFVYGAFFATIIAAILEAIFIASGSALSQNYPSLDFVFLNGNTTAGALFLVLVIAPFVEEALKASGVIAYRSTIRQIADGPVLGASVGLGFGFFETFLYGFAGFVEGGLEAAIFLIAIRSLSAVLLHGSSTAVFGYGYAESAVTGRGHGGASHYLAAVGMHSSYNAVVSLGTFALLLGASTEVQNALALVGVLLAILLAFYAIEYVRRLIAQSSYPGALANHPRYPPPYRGR